VLDYCCTVWGKDTYSYINKVNSIQKRAAKIILNRPIRSPTLDLFNKLKWLKIISE
jgi:hypothetical protein